MGPLELLVLILIVMLVIGALPAWPHSRSWGYYPSGALTIILVIVLVVVLMRLLP